jgi:hypothetical protein
MAPQMNMMTGRKMAGLERASIMFEGTSQRR